MLIDVDVAEALPDFASDLDDDVVVAAPLDERSLRWFVTLRFRSPRRTTPAWITVLPMSWIEPAPVICARRETLLPLSCYNVYELR